MIRTGPGGQPGQWITSLWLEKSFLERPWITRQSEFCQRSYLGGPLTLGTGQVQGSGLATITGLRGLSYMSRLLHALLLPMFVQSATSDQ